MSLSLSVTGPHVHGGVAVIQTKFRRALRAIIVFRRRFFGKYL